MGPEVVRAAAPGPMSRALMIAARAHDGQVDKNGEPYILHPLRIMLELEDPTDRVVAVLHDVVEDSDWTLDGLRAEGFSDEVIAAVDAISRREDEEYMEYVRRAGAHRTARRVKLADLRDNMRQTRLRVETERDKERLQRYRRALELLESVDGGP